MITFNLKATEGSHVDSATTFRCWFLETQYDRPGTHGAIDLLTPSNEPLGLFCWDLEPLLYTECLGRLLGHVIYRGNGHDFY